MEQSVKHKKNRKQARKKGRLKQLLPYIAIILVAACLVAAVILVTGRRGIYDNANPSIVELDKSSAPSETDSGRIEQDTNPEIAALVQRYFEAAKTADADTLNQIVETDTSFDAERLKMESEYIESYSNISCYTIPGIVDGTYIVYVYYEVKFLTIDTKAPSLVRFYICENSDGSMYINRRAMDGEVASYMHEVENWQEIRDLSTDVNNKLKEAIDSDDKLKQFVAMLSGETPASTGGNESSGLNEDEQTSGEAQTEDNSGAEDSTAEKDNTQQQ